MICTHGTNFGYVNFLYVHAFRKNGFSDIKKSTQKDENGAPFPSMLVVFGANVYLCHRPF